MRVWDLPLRVFHWTLVIAVIGAVVSAKADIMWLHERFGLTIMGLIGFRLIWGVFGGYYARFAQFMTSPKTAVAEIWNLLKPQNNVSLGHSAAAGYAVIALLSILGYLTLTGSMSNDDVLFDGPLAHLAPSWSNWATKLHNIGEPLLLSMVALHIGAILFYKYVKKRNLTMPMINGRASGDKLLLLAQDGDVSSKHKIFGLVLLFSCVLAANALTFLRPAF